MAGNVVNLNRFRKKKLREEKAKQAEINRARHGPEMGFHMWTEVWIKGQWLALDSTLGRGSIGAAHIKISDHSWHDMHSLKPLLPVHRVLGKMTIEVLNVE